jgi:hypothetical protein
MIKWSKNDIDLLILNYKDNSNDKLSKIIGKSLLSINNKANELGLKKSISYIKNLNKEKIKKKWGDNLWKKEEIDFLISNINSLTNFEISNKLNRSINSIISMCNKLNLKRNKKFNKEYVEKECLKYITKSELRISDPNLYHWLYRNGKMNDVSGHMLSISYSTPQLILKYLLDKLTNLQFTYNDRKAIAPYEIDIFFPLFKFGIEYDGSYYHKVPNSFKENLCRKNGIDLLIINEDNLSKKNFESYVKNIKDQILINKFIINDKLKINLNSEDIKNLKIDKNQIFKGLFDITKLKKICDKYIDYTLFVKEQKNIYNKLYYLGLLSDFTSHMKIDEEIKEMKYLIERKDYYNIDDIVLIEYWYNSMICPVKIIEKQGSKYKVSHNIEQSKIKNAPDELIKSSEIVDHYR